MESKELYRCLLGLNEPWSVERVELDMERQQVDVHVVHESGTRFACPECGLELAVYGHLGERVWRHLDSCQFLIPAAASSPGIVSGAWGKASTPAVGGSGQSFHPHVRGAGD